MSKKIAVSTLNASTIDIINTIRANASSEYQSTVPEITSETDIPAVGEILMGYPSLANQFLNALINRIALVRVKSANFNNAYKELKKGYLEFGETVEEVFVNIAKAREFSVEKAEAREFKRTLPDVRTAFHAINWRVQYPVTIQDQDLRQAFTSIDGVQDLIARIVDSIYTANEYDEYLLFKYLIIKAITSGKMYPVSIGDGSDPKAAAVAFRGLSNKIQFVSDKYNASGVHTSTPKDDQFIFMDADYNAGYDVNVLASAFNMDRAEFIGRLELVDDWTTFDNDRFSIITANTNQVEPVTDEELALMANVRAVLVDREWFQIYDNLDKFTEQYSGAGMYWNYFYNVWKTVSSSPFSNAVVFVTDSATITAPDTLTVEVTDKSVSENAITLTVAAQFDDPTVSDTSVTFTQTEALTTAGIGVHKYGAILIPASQFATAITLEATIGDTAYKAADSITSAANVGDTVTLSKVTEDVEDSQV